MPPKSAASNTSGSMLPGPRAVGCDQTSSRTAQSRRWASAMRKDVYKAGVGSVDTNDDVTGCVGRGR